MKTIKEKTKSVKEVIKSIILLLLLLSGSQVCEAQTSVTSGTATQGYTLNATALCVDVNLSITSSSAISGFRATISTGLKVGDVLAYTGTLPSGITSTAYNSTTGVLAFTGSTTAANWQTLMRTVTFSNTNTAQYGDRTITFSAGTASSFSNGHFYELISSPTLTWTAAKAAAEARSYLGMGGYLATITSAAENAYIKQTLAANAWMGASDEFSQINTATGVTTYANQAAAEGRFTWVTGPEKGTLFSIGNGSPVTQSGQFAYWYSGEPNNSGTEHYGQIYSSGTGQWNDLPNGSSIAYVVEYGGLSTDPPINISANTTIYTLISTNTTSASQSLCGSFTPSTITGTTPTGGTGTYTYSWLSSTTSSTTGFAVATGTTNGINYSPSSLSVTTWFKRVVNSGTLKDTTTAVSVIVNPALTAITSQSNVSCNGTSTGSATVVPSGGTAAYTYAWSGGGTAATKSNIAAGNYTCTITDAVGCTSVQTFTITQPTALAATTSQTNVACNGGSTGSGTVTASGGTATYTYAWSGGGTAATKSGLVAGTYTCTITDANSCSTIRNFTITQPTALTASTSQTNVSCNGGTNGSATVTASGGTSAYTYVWSGGGTSATKSGLVAATYTCTITDANTCTSVQTFTITQPTALTATTTQTNVGCNGGSTGSATVTASGGTATYTYAWSGGGTSATKSGLVAGTYTCTTTDANTCTSVQTFTISQPTALTATTSQTNVGCNGGSSGSATVIASGGTATYTYAWSGGGTSATKSGLVAGTYTCTITDANSCSTTKNFTITQPTALTATTSQTNLLCNGTSTGSATVTPSGGTATYTYAWSSGGTAATKSSLIAGTYTCTITDANSCTSVQTFTITQPAALTATTSQTNVNCNGGSTGSATVTASGGTATYTYVWSGGGTAATKGSLNAGTYTCTITDANSCTSVQTFTITQPTTLTATTAQTNVACNGGSTGSATVTPSGGTASYTYAWSGGGTAATKSSIVAGTYTCTITDANSCSTTKNFTITQPAALTATTSQTNVACNGGSTGSATVTPSGGTVSYSYVWTPFGGTTATASLLSSGAFTCTITDANSCSTTKNFTITQPTTLTSTTSQTDVSCNGGSTGSAAVTPSGGTATYTYAWSGGGTAATKNNLTAGTYSCTITDANNCSLVEILTITEPAALTATTSQTNVNCNGDSTGFATVTPSGGTATYTYAWSGGGTAAIKSGLVAGTYTCTVTDANGCTTVKNIIITQPAILSATQTVNDATCSTLSDGDGLVNGSGGTSPYSYAWSNGETSNSLSGISAGSYSVTITDAQGCTHNESISVNNQFTVSTTFTASNVSCNGDATGSALTIPTGGTAPYNYSWSNGSINATANGLSATTYSVTITDDNGCVYTDNITITEPSAMAASTSALDANCNASADGEVMVDQTTGGVAPYTYEWSTGATTVTDISLTAGTYTVTITDDNGCTLTTTATVNEPTAMAANATTVSVTCNGLFDGSATVAPSGGTFPFSYSWDDGQTLATATGLSAQTMSVTITDDHGCTHIETITISEPMVLSSTYTSVDVTCNGLADGASTITVAGGTSPYTYIWSTGSLTDTETGLPAGTYSVIVNDINGCTSIETVTVNEPDALASTMSQVNVTCNGASDGSATINITGGIAPYNYLWDGGSTSDNATGLSAQLFAVTVTDSNGCIYNESVFITEPDELTITASGIDPLCNAGTDGSAFAQPNGGTAPYNYVWSSGGTSDMEPNLSMGTYTVTVTDANGCSSEQIVTITEPSAIALSSTTIQANCGQSNGSGTVLASGGTGNYSYNWSTGGTADVENNLGAGNYNVIVTDVNSCTSSIVVSVSNLGAPTVAFSQSNVSCNSGSNGSVYLSASGGMGTYTYNWSNSATTDNITGLPAGTYTYEVTDSANCQTAGSVIIAEPSAITIAAITVNETQGNDGSIDLTVTGGTAPYSYLWNTGDIVEDPSNMAAGIYTVSVTDANNCTQSSTITVSSSVGLNDHNVNPLLSIYPNPNSGTFVIKGSKAEHYTLLNNLGQVIQTINLTANDHYTITVGNLDNGIYFTRNNNAESNVLSKIVVIR